jgi:uncharacterized protein YndB with AHSA1/START domain
MEINKENKTTKMERVFNATKEQLWKAHSTPELIAQWWGQDGTENTIEKLDFTNGGSWRFVSKDGQGNEYAFKGEYKDIKPMDSFSWTFEFEGMPGKVITESFEFEDMGDGKTKLTNLAHYATMEELEGMADSGMEAGANESWNRLERLVGTMNS